MVIMQGVKQNLAPLLHRGTQNLSRQIKEYTYIFFFKHYIIVSGTIKQNTLQQDRATMERPIIPIALTAGH